MTEWENEFRSKKIRNVSRKKKGIQAKALKLASLTIQLYFMYFFKVCLCKGDKKKA